MNELDPEEELERLHKQYLLLQSEGATPEALKQISDKYFEILEEIREEELSDEIEWAALLIENDAVAPNIFNTFEWVNTCINQLEDPLETETHLCNTFPSHKEWKIPLIERDEYIFDDAWRGLEVLKRYKDYFSGIGVKTEEYKENGVHFYPIEHFLATIRVGCIPRPELLLSVAKAFHLYFARKGELTLEEVFFGAPTKLGNYAKRRNEKFKGIDFKQFEHSVRRANDGTTIEKLAEHFIKSKIFEESDEKLKLEDVDTFLRKYRRWKVKQGINKSASNSNKPHSR